VLPTFIDRIAPGADPWVILHEGSYYWCLSDGCAVSVYHSDRLAELGEKFLVWQAPLRGPHSSEIWAPELHRVDGRWYIYVAASDGRNENHRMIVLESDAVDPAGDFHFKAEIYTGDDRAQARQNRWAIDGTLLVHDGVRYFIWSGWQDELDVQSLYIARMANPWTLASERVRLCANDDYLWERVGEKSLGRGLNEAPQVLQREGRTFLVYSASASWERSYKLGMLELSREGDPLKPQDWRKHSEPVFQPTAAVWGVGHCSFTRSPDGAENWIVYHSKVSPRPGWPRHIRAQRYYWDDQGWPVFGVPLSRRRRRTAPLNVVENSPAVFSPDMAQKCA
jgi:GH43 family beta-xylosidase